MPPLLPCPMLTTPQNTPRTQCNLSGPLLAAVWKMEAMAPLRLALSSNDQGISGKVWVCMNRCPFPSAGRNGGIHLPGRLALLRERCRLPAALGPG